MLGKLSLEEIKPSTRKSPFIHFKPFRESGSNILEINKLNKSIDGQKLIKNFSLEIYKGEKIAFIGRDSNIITALFDILAGEIEPDEGSFKWGITTEQAYFPKDNGKYFETDLNLINWLRQFTKDQDITYIRGFLGKMLFSGDETLKPVNVLSGGEKVRCMLSKVMASEANVLIFDDPTNHLDLESITALNNAMIDFPETILFTSHDHQLIQSVATRIIELTPNGYINKQMSYEEYIENEDVKKRQAMIYSEEFAKA